MHMRITRKVHLHRVAEARDAPDVREARGAGRDRDPSGIRWRGEFRPDAGPARVVLPRHALEPRVVPSSLRR